MPGDGGGLFMGLTSGCVRALYKLILPYAYSSSTPAGPTSSHDSFITSSTSSGVKIGLMLQIIAMRPAVNGVANEVPLAECLEGHFWLRGYVTSCYVARLLLILNNNLRWEWVGRLLA